ncbi:MAG: hypothetical protein ACI8PZ_001799 [Myxococcota bacterium]
MSFVDDDSRASAIAEAANGVFDEVLFVKESPADISAFLIAASALPVLDGVPLFLTDTARDPAVLESAAAARDRFEQVRGTAPARPSGPTFDALAVAYAARHGAAGFDTFAYTAQSHDAAWLVCMGHAWGLYQHDEVSGFRIAQGLRRASLGQDVSLRASSWNLLKAAFKVGSSVDVEGASGVLDYDVAGETTAPVEVWTITAGGDDFESQEVYLP